MNSHFINYARGGPHWQKQPLKQLIKIRNQLWLLSNWYTRVKCISVLPCDFKRQTIKLLILTLFFSSWLFLLNFKLRKLKLDSGSSLSSWLWVNDNSGNCNWLRVTSKQRHFGLPGHLEIIQIWFLISWVLAACKYVSPFT